MQSKNKKAPTAAEAKHIAWIKEQPCVICDQAGPSDCHEVNQGQWFTSIPLCKDCHQGSHNGIHGQKRMWILMKMDELAAIAKTFQRFALAFRR